MVNAFFYSKPIFETKEWRELKSQTNQILTQKVAYQTINFVSSLINTVERAKKPRPYDCLKSHQALCLINEFLKVIQQPFDEIPLLKNDSEAIAFAKAVLQRAKENHLDENKVFIEISDKDVLQQWMVNVRKLYIDMSQ